MFVSYAIRRWRFTRGFEPDGEDFVYRPRPTAPAIRVSSAEREELLRAFRRQFWLYRLGTLGAMLASLFLLVGLGLLMPDGSTETFVTVGTFVIFVPMVLVVLVLDRRLSELPARRFGDRARVAPKRTWREAYDQRARRRSWTFYAGWVLALVALARLTFPGPHAVWWGLPAWFAYFGLALAAWSYNVWRKYQADRWSPD